MPLRPSLQGIGSTVGKRLFGTSNTSIIQRKIQQLDKSKLTHALKEHGVRGGMTARKMVDVLTGKASASSTKQLKGAAQALQSLGVTAEPDLNTGRLITESTKRAGQDEHMVATGTLRPNAASFGASASFGSRVAEARIAREGNISERPLEQARSIKEVREMLRSLGVADRRIVAKKVIPS